MWDAEFSLVASHLNQAPRLVCHGDGQELLASLNSWTVTLSLLGENEWSMFGMRDPPVFIPAPVDRYRQILLPALRLCQVILTSSTAQHLQAAGQVRGVLGVEGIMQSPFTIAQTRGIDSARDFTFVILSVAALGVESQPLVLCCELHWPALIWVKPHSEA